MSLNDIVKRNNGKWRYNGDCLFSIVFNGEKAVYFNKLISMLSNYVYETYFILENGKMTFKIMNPERTTSFKIEKKIDYKGNKIRIPFDIEDLSKISIPKKKDVKFNFLKDKIIVEKIDKKGHYTNKELLNVNDDDIEEIDLKRLLSIKYNKLFSITKECLIDFLSEVGDYSDIIKIEINDEGVKFIEEGSNGQLTYPILKKDLFEYECKNFQTESVVISLSLLKDMKPVLDLLKDDDKISFRLKHLIPLHILINLEEHNINMNFFLAPRVEEEEIKEYENKILDYET